MLQKLSGVERIGALIITGAAVAGILNAGYQHFMTRGEAHEEHSELVEQIIQNQKTYLERDKNDRLDRHDREIARHERSLIEGNLSERERDFLGREIQRLEKLKECIREETC